MHDQAPQEDTTCASLLVRVRDPADEGAWQEFERRYAELIRRYCRRRGLSPVDTDDVSQIVWMNLAQGLRKFEYDPSKGRFRAYLGRVVQNAIARHFSRYRQAAGRLAVFDEVLQFSGDDGDADEQWEREWVDHHYRLAMKTIKETFACNTVTVFRRLAAGESTAQVAADLEMTEAAVNQAKHRIRERMRSLIARQVLEEDDPEAYGSGSR